MPWCSVVGSVFFAKIQSIIPLLDFVPVCFKDSRARLAPLVVLLPVFRVFSRVCVFVPCGSIASCLTAFNHPRRSLTTVRCLIWARSNAPHPIDLVFIVPRKVFQCSKEEGKQKV